MPLTLNKIAAMMKYDKLKLILIVDDYFLKVIYYIEIYQTWANNSTSDQYSQNN